MAPFASTVTSGSVRFGGVGQTWSQTTGPVPWGQVLVVQTTKLAIFIMHKVEN